MELKDKLKYSISAMGQLQKLIVINIIFFIIPLLLNTFLWLFELKDISIIDYFVVEADFMSLIFKPWSLITYGFLHGSFSHLFWNMIMLFYFGNILVNYFGDKRLLNVFFNGILFGGIIYIISYNLFPVFTGVSSKMIGSSAGVMAILFYVTSYNPNHTIRFFFLNIKLLYIAIFLLLMDIIQIPVENSGGHIAHLGGALIGFLMFRSFSVRITSRPARTPKVPSYLPPVGWVSRWLPIKTGWASGSSPALSANILPIASIEVVSPAWSHQLFSKSRASPSSSVSV